MTLDCVNSGGPGTIIRLPDLLEYEKAVELPPGISAALQSWQGRAGEALTVVDREGTNWRARLEVAGEMTRFVPFEQLRQPVESPVEIAVYQALPDKERFELVLQKLTELGVSRVVPVTTERSITRQERDAGQKKSHKWPDVLLKAARQCRRAMIPELAEVCCWADALADASRYDLKIILYEGEVHWTMDEVVRGQQPVSAAILIGPEGGFTEAEVEQARNIGAVPVSLGPRVLRTETAAIAAMTVMQYAVGDMKAQGL